MWDVELIPTVQPKLEFGPLDGAIPTDIIEVPDECLNSQSELIASILDSENDEEFNALLAKLRPCPEPISIEVTVDPLGIYIPKEKLIKIDKDKIDRCANHMGGQGASVDFDQLTRIVRIHEDSHALHHLAGDIRKNNEIWNQFIGMPPCVTEMLAQLFTYHALGSNGGLVNAFYELEKRQPLVYHLWRLFKHCSEKRLYWMIRDQPDRIKNLLERMGFVCPPKAISGRGITRIAKDIQGDRGGNIRGGDMPGVIHKGYPYPANCYPGKPGEGCFETAFFVSLTARRYANPDKGHLSFREMLGYFVRHMQNQYSGITKQAYILTDNWDPDAYDEWKPVIDKLRLAAKVEAYLIAGRTYSLIRI